MVKAIFFDIDGTLVSFKNHQIPKSTFDALYKLKEKGIKLFIATGRGKDGLDVLNDFPFDGYITLNGQYCYTNNQIIYSNTIKKEDLQALLDYLKDHQVPCGFTEENTSTIVMSVLMQFMLLLIMMIILPEIVVMSLINRFIKLCVLLMKMKKKKS